MRATERSQQQLFPEGALWRSRNVYSGNPVMYPIGADNEYKILLIEKNRQLARTLLATISSCYQFFRASDGASGLEMVLSIVPDVVVCNIDIPDIDGYQITTYIKSNINTCHIPVLLISERSFTDGLIKAFNSGSDAYMIMPLDIQVFMSQLKRLIQNRELIYKKYKKQYYMIDYASDISNKESRFIHKVNEIIEQNISETDFNAARIAHTVNLSKTQVYRKIKALTGCSTVEYIRLIRLNKAAHMLKKNHYYVKEVCYKVGFNSFSYFVRCFKNHYGITPTKFKRKFFYNKQNDRSIPFCFSQT